MTRASIVLALLLGAVLAPGVSNGQQDSCVTAVDGFVSANPGIAAGNIFAILNGQRKVGCILGQTDASGILERYLTLHNSAASATSKAVARTELFDLALGQFANRPISHCSSANDTACMVGRHVGKIRDLRNALASSSVIPAADIISTSSWAVVDSNGAIAISNINLSTYLAQECATDVSGTDCHAAIALSGSFMRTSLAMDQVIVAFNLPMIEANAVYLSQRDREWDAYFNVVSVQFPWELGVNSWRFTRANKAQLGNFPRAPNSKFVVLHPSLGFEHGDAISGGTSTNAAVFLEVFGYERWRWRDGNARNRWGISAIASYADIPGMDSVGYGLLLHTPIKNIAIGAVRRDGDAGSQTSIVFNINFATFLEAYKNQDLKDFLAP